jgi:hypothetical protein
MMKKIFSFGIILFLFWGCTPDQTGICYKGAGEIVTYETEVAPFNEIMVYERVKLFIEQGEEQKIRIETGENLKEEVSVEVVDSRLSIRNNNSCNLFRDYEVTKVYVTVTNLSWLQNSSGSAIETLNTLKQEELWLRSVNQEDDLSIHTDGDFKLSLDVKNLRITNDNYSNYFLEGEVANFNVFFAAGDARLEARDLAVQHYDIFHRGTNKMFLNPIQSISGEIRSSGDVICVNRPPNVAVESFYTGKLSFEAP